MKKETSDIPHTRTQRDKTEWIAWGVSLGFHAILLATFAVIGFTRATQQSRGSTATFHLEQIQSVMQAEPLLPKPKIRRMPLVHSEEATVVQPRQEISITELLKKSPPPASLDHLQRYSSITDQVGFFGSLTNKRKICFVVDCSGSMQGLFGRVRKELKDSLLMLQPDQYFYIILFRGENLLEFSEGRMVRAGHRAKTDAFDFIDAARPAGTTNAVRALRRGLEIPDSRGRPPQQVYFLTDGLDLGETDTAGFAARVEALRREIAPHTVIHTIGFWTGPGDLPILRQIAENSGGVFKNITD